MKLFIVGQKWLAAQLLKQCLAEGFEVTGVAAPTADDALAVEAGKRGLSAQVADRVLSAGSIPDGVDLICAAHAHCFIPAATRARARLGALGYHPSLLPRHRGRDAIRWAIHMREQMTGGTIYWMDDGADTGPVALQDWCHIKPGDDAATLWRRDLAPMGLRLYSEALRMAVTGALPAVTQNDELATWEPAMRGGLLSRS